MKKWKQIVGVALLIILGGLGGSITTKAYLMRWFHLIGSSPQARTDFLMEKMARLNLTQDQEEKVQEIIKQVEEELQKRKRQDIETMMDEIKKVLDSDQQKKLETFMKKFEKRRKKIEEDYLRK
jgi:cell shape-determining protein MreC